MGCFYHPDNEAVNTCSRCGQSVCAVCNLVTGTQPICRNCWENKVSAQIIRTPDKSTKLTEPVEKAEEKMLQVQDREQEYKQEQVPVDRSYWETSTIPVETADENVSWQKPTIEGQSSSKESPVILEQSEEKAWQHQMPEEHKISEISPAAFEPVKQETRQEQTSSEQLDMEIQSNQSEPPAVFETVSTHTAEGELQKSEWIPCPLCGESLVESTHGYWKRILRYVMTTRGLILMGTVTAIIGIVLGILFPPLFMLIGLSGIFFVLIRYASSIRSGLGINYHCNSCNFAWTSEEVENRKEYDQVNTF